jgi:acetyltransferase-like isoleucine patch superfamily enzyme
MPHLRRIASSIAFKGFSLGIISLNRLAPLRAVVLDLRRRWLWMRHGVRIHPTSSISMSGRTVSRKRGMIVVGADTLVAFKTLLISYDSATGRDVPIRIGERSFVGGGAVILPGVTVGNEAVVAAGAVVLSDVPDRTIVGGNPARILRRDIEVSKRGRLLSADANSRRLWRED